MHKIQENLDSIPSIFQMIKLYNPAGNHMYMYKFIFSFQLQINMYDKTKFYIG